MDKNTALPADWQQYAQVASKPVTLDPAEISKNRDSWIQQWSDLVS